MNPAVFRLGVQYQRLYAQHIRDHHCSAHTCDQALHLLTLSVNKTREATGSPLVRQSPVREFPLIPLSKEA